MKVSFPKNIQNVCLLNKWKVFFIPLLQRTIWIHGFVCLSLVFALPRDWSGPNLVFQVHFPPLSLPIHVSPIPVAHSVFHSLCSYTIILHSFTAKVNSICHFLLIITFLFAWWHPSHFIKGNTSVILPANPSQIYPELVIPPSVLLWTLSQL